MEATSQLRFAKHMKFDVSTLYMRQKAVISADTVHMALNEAHLEGSSLITASKKGPKAGQGLAPGFFHGSAGSGAGHGGQGAPGSTVAGGSGYGSYVYPLHPGSGGGGSNGGAGGSTIKVKEGEVSVQIIAVEFFVCFGSLFSVISLSAVGSFSSNMLFHYWTSQLISMKESF